MKNCALIWETMCKEVVGCNQEGDPTYRITGLGMIVSSLGISTSYYELMIRNYPEGVQKMDRAKAAAFLREFADGIEAGT